MFGIEWISWKPFPKPTQDPKTHPPTFTAAVIDLLVAEIGHIPTDIKPLMVIGEARNGSSESNIPYLISPAMDCQTARPIKA